MIYILVHWSNFFFRHLHTFINFLSLYSIYWSNFYRRLSIYIVVMKEELELLLGARKETRKETAHKFTGIGFVLLFIQVLPYLLFNLNIIDLFGPLSGFLEAIYFLVTMMLLTAGLYFLIISYIYSRPHTALLFVSIKERKKKLVAIFPGWDSVEAQQVVSAINRVHRRI